MERPWDQTTREQLAALWVQGVTQADMSRRLGISKKVVGHLVGADPEAFPPRRRPQPPAAPRRGTQLLCGHRFRFIASPKPGDRLWCQTCDAATYVGTPER